MKIVFSPYYDGQVFSGKKDGCLLGVKYVGPKGLLAELELRAGLCRRDEVSETGRLTAYYKALKDCGEGREDAAGLFYWKAFLNDGLNVARRLLEWRDALVYAGWKDCEVPEGIGRCTGAVLDGLAQVEDYFETGPGEADIWRALIGCRGYLTDVEVQLNVPEAYVDKVVMDCLKGSGCRITCCESDPEKPETVQKRFADHTSACQWAMTEPQGEDSVYVNTDNVTLNAVLASLGKPYVDSSYDRSYTRISRLFRSGIAQFAPSVDYSSLMAYLSSPCHPLDESVDEGGTKLTFLLRSHLERVGGFGYNEYTGKDWAAVLDSCSSSEGECKERYIGFWGKEKVDMKVLETYCRDMAAWITDHGMKNPSSEVREQLMQVRDRFRALPELLAAIGAKEMEYADLEKIADSLDTDGSLSGDVARRGSVEAVSDVRLVAGKCGRIVWMDCYDRGMLSYRYDFMNNTDIRRLNEAGFSIPTYEAQLSADDYAVRLALSYADKVEFLYPEKAAGERCAPHPVAVSLCGDEMVDMTGYEPSGKVACLVQTVPADTQKAEHQLPSGFFCQEGAEWRSKESFSSLEVLIHNPFDYVLEYLCGCKPSDNSRESAVKGNVAHELFNKAIMSSGSDIVKAWDDIKHELTENFEGNFDRAVANVGLALNAGHNVLAKRSFRKTLQEVSIPAFISLIEDNGLEIIGSEKSFLIDVKGLGAIDARIDLLCRNRRGKYVIVDFKWTDSKAEKRKEEIEKRRHYQLALYSEVVKNAYGEDVDEVGYFMLRQGVFYPTSEPNADLMALIRNSYDFRMKQLKGVDGITVLEDAEGMKLKEVELEYVNAEGDRVKLKESNASKSTYAKNAILRGKLK